MKSWVLTGGVVPFLRPWIIGESPSNALSAKKLGIYGNRAPRFVQILIKFLLKWRPSPRNISVIKEQAPILEFDPLASVTSTSLLLVD